MSSTRFSILSSVPTISELSSKRSTMEKIIGKVSGDLTGTVSRTSLEIDRVKKGSKIRQKRIFISHDDFTVFWKSKQTSKLLRFSGLRSLSKLSNPLDGASEHITKGSQNLLFLVLRACSYRCLGSAFKRLLTLWLSALNGQKQNRTKKSKILAINIIKCVLKKTQTMFSSIRGKPKLNGALRIKICNSWNCCASVNMTEWLWLSKNFDGSKLQKLYSWRQVSSFLFLVKV